VQVESCDSLANVTAAQWNALGDGRNPFVRHEFLSALETNGCVASEFGWHAFHLLLRNDDGDLIAAAPGYVKTNSYGEFVFDWAWAEAYERAGGQYYPKLICAIPFTPATGPRLLVKAGHNEQACAAALYDAAITIVEQQGWSGVHWLFPPEHEAKRMQDRNYMLRIGCQYIWSNDNYTDFEDFLSRCTAKKRKNMRRERKRVAEQQVTLTVKHGGELNAQDWEQVTGFYLDTFNRKWGTPTLNASFFSEIGKTMGDQVIVVFALHNNKRVACSVMLKGSDTLYGRYWGCNDDFHSLHFEACYYQGIDYCIANGLQRFEPGAQGEHKIGRGFKPTLTWSTHYLCNESFRDAVRKFLDHERPLMEQHCKDLHELLPFKQTVAPE
jgi:predicted N-acyltransferase